MMNRFFICCVGIFAITNSFCQDLKFYLVEYTCDENTNYLQLGKTESIYIDGNKGSINNDSIKSYKLQSKNFEISKNYWNTDIKPKTLGTSTLIAKVKLKNGKKVTVSQDFEVVEMPEIVVDISVTSPDLKFMWLTITDRKTGVPINPNDYDFCMLDFELIDSTGKIKESGAYFEKNDFFPSVTLMELPSKFELNDQLHIGLSLVHKKYNLIVGNGGQIITITKLWN